MVSHSVRLRKKTTCVLLLFLTNPLLRNTTVTFYTSTLYPQRIATETVLILPHVCPLFPLRFPLNSSPDNNVGSLGTWCALSETRGTTENIPMNINNVTRGLAPICIAMPATDWAIGNLYWGMAAMLTALIPAQCVTGSVYTLCYNMCKTCSASHHDPTTGPVYLISWEPREKSTFNQISTLLTTTHTSQNFDEY